MVKVEYGGGLMSIVDTDDLLIARRVVRSAYGQDQDLSPYVASVATQDDLDWLKGMGGTPIEVD